MSSTASLTPRSLKVTYRSLRDLVPYARNARTHTPEQIRKIRASLARFGWTNPMLIAGADMIAGHARLSAALAMASDGEAIAGHDDPWVGPTIDLSHLTPAERRAYVIADNRLALDAGWDDGLLRMEFNDLQLEGFDLALTGFDMKELTEIMVPPGDAADKQDREFTEAENDMLDTAWHRLIGEWRELMETAHNREWVSTTFTKGNLAVLYLRSLFLGDDIPRSATLAYTRHRLWTDANKGTIASIFAQALSPEARNLRNSIRWVSIERPGFDKIIGATSLPIHAHRMPNDFPALLARDLIDEFATTREAVILDPCHGWGGRMLGFLLSDRAVHYDGIDAAPETCQGVQEMFDDLSVLTPHRRKTCSITCAPFETVALDHEVYDVAITSPPYFDTEKYPGEQSSWRVYQTFDDWLHGFYHPLIANTAKALKPYGVFALQVGSQSYPLKDKAIELAPKCGMVHTETRHTGMINNRMGTQPDDGEVVVILRKS